MIDGLPCFFGRSSLCSMQPPRREVNFKATNARAVIEARQTPVAEESPQKKADYGKVPE